ncbi:MAG: hypothetical protein F6K24_25660 [Okeania sp. SIO2D1]|nr:hypothetical protein [Okeania sp. SIO2D1]
MKLIKEFLSRDFENVEISEPTVITANTVNYSEAKTNISSSQEIAKAALLNETQLNSLLQIDRTLPAGRVSPPPYNKVVVPTYIPQGFELAELRVGHQERQYGAYTLIYKNSNNNCFGFDGYAYAPFGGPPFFANTIYAHSPALGRVTIALSSSVRIDDQYVRFFLPIEGREFGSFDFYSPAYLQGKRCKAMNFVEAVKVAESFQFLQPDVEN